MDDLLNAWKRDDRVKVLSLANRGLLIEVLLFLEEHGPTPEDVVYQSMSEARLSTVPAAEAALAMSESKAAGLLSVDEKGNVVSPLLSSTNHSQAMMAIWNESVNGILPRIREMTAARRRQANKRLREDMGGKLEEWRSVVERVIQTPFLCGVNNTLWRASFDWVIQPRNLAKVREGNYDRTESSGVLTPYEHRLKEWIKGGRHGEKPQPG